MCSRGNVSRTRIEMFLTEAARGICRGCKRKGVNPGD